MKIVNQPTDATRATQKTEAVVRGRDVNGPDRSSRTERSDRVQLSTVAAELARSEPTQTPVSTDNARLEALRQAVQDGTLPRDDRALAQKIADEDVSWPAADKPVSA
jgi:flagellar biosynthesis anti-sigma factor FlgM